ncbi:hypothetical protein TNCV_1823001 [Trichonephila clavipes]|nr:hypothetical protein TNCV_1823001 [Trichonephila clavipes]
MDLISRSRALGSSGEGKHSISFNMYQPPDLKSLPTDLQDLFTMSTVCLGDLNVKTPFGAVPTANPRGNELLDIIDDKCFSILNDGTATHFTYSYNPKGSSRYFNRQF